MVEGGVDDAVCRGRAVSETIQILERPAMDPGASCRESCRPRVGADKTEHLMAGIDQLLNDGGSDKARSTGDENTHHDFSLHFVSRPHSRPRDN